MDQERGFLVLLILAVGAVAAFMLKPFLPYVMGAAILAFVMRPLHIRLRTLIGDSLSSGFLVFLSIFLAIVPMILAGAVVIDDARELSNNIEDFDAINFTQIDSKIEEMTGESLDLENRFRDAIRNFATVSFGNVSQIFSLIANLAIGLSLMLFLQYYLIKDGEKLVGWLRNTSPLPNDIQESLLQRTNQTTWAVIKGHVLVALVQGLIAGLGLYFTGIPNPYFWTFVMTLLAFLPIVGSFLIWGPAVVYLLMIGNVFEGVFLAVYGLTVVSLTDNILRPLFVDRSSELHPAVIIIGVLGGVYLFGAPGLFIGPIVLGVLKSTLAVFSNNYSS